MDRRDLLARSGALALAALAGCSGALRAPGANGDVGPDLPSGEPAVDDDQLAELATGNATFALDLHRQLTSDSTANQFLSPYSISVALAMTYAGARGETETQMRETLQYTLGEDAHAAFGTLAAELEERSTTQDPVEDETVDAFQLAVANALWGREGYPFSDSYQSLVESHYGDGLRRADFAGDPAGERERINEWVAERTEDRIENLLPQGSLTPATVLVLTNAIYFMASWQFEFDPADTEAGSFRALDGSTATVPMMRQNLRTNYANVSGAQAIELPYVGEEVSMVLIVPDEGEFESFEQGLDAEGLFGIFDALGDATGDIRMPRFEFESDVQLSDVLSELGMPVAFGGDANFDGMVEGGGGDLWIDEVYHKAFVSVDEEGTEAAAATAVVMEESMPAVSFDLTLDRPFVFVIRDRPTDAVLFLGRVTNAGAAQD